jgi:hypothetical protein
LNLLIIGTWATWNAAGVISQIDGYAFYEYDWYNEHKIQVGGAHHACASFGIIVVSARFFDRFFPFRHLLLAAHQELVE